MAENCDSNDLVPDNLRGDDNQSYNTKKEKPVSGSSKIPKQYKGQSGSKFFNEIKTICGDFYQGDQTTYTDCKFQGGENGSNQENIGHSNEATSDTSYSNSNITNGGEVNDDKMQAEQTIASREGTQNGSTISNVKTNVSEGKQSYFRIFMEKTNNVISRVGFEMGYNNVVIGLAFIVAVAWVAKKKLV